MIESVFVAGGPAERRASEVAAVAAAEAELKVGDASERLVGADARIGAADREADAAAEGGAPAIEAIRPHVAIRPPERELGLLEHTPLRRIEERADGAIVGRRSGAEDVRGVA